MLVTKSLRCKECGKQCIVMDDVVIVVCEHCWENAEE